MQKHQDCFFFQIFLRKLFGGDCWSFMFILGTPPPLCTQHLPLAASFINPFILPNKGRIVMPWCWWWWWFHKQRLEASDWQASPQNFCSLLSIRGSADKELPTFSNLLVLYQTTRCHNLWVSLVTQNVGLIFERFFRLISRASGCKMPTLRRSLGPRVMYFPIHPSSRQSTDTEYTPLDLEKILWKFVSEVWYLGQ